MTLNESSRRTSDSALKCRRRRAGALSALLAALLLLLLSSPSARAGGYYPHSNCNRDTGWTKGNGPAIKSFLKSIVPSPTPCPANPRAHATFNSNRRFATSVAVDFQLLTFGWKKHGNKEFDGWLYGRFLNIREMSGRDLIFVYDDYQTVLVGSWEKGQLRSGRRARIKGYRCKNGILELQTTRPRRGTPEYFYEQPTVGRVTSMPTVMNAFDVHSLYIRNSNIPAVVGDGIFAKRDIYQGSLVGYYAGAPLYDYATVMFPNMTAEEREERHKNLLSFNDDYDLDCPDSNIVTYRAALGHKANHAFDANVKFCFVKSPRFGETRCLEATKDIKKGDEIYVDYRYNLDSSYVPRWYKKLYYETYPEEKTTPAWVEDDPKKKKKQQE